MLLIRNIFLTVVGLLLYVLTVILPILRLVYFDWIALIVLCLPWILDVYSMYKEDTYKHTDAVKKWDTVVDYIDRNRDVRSLICNRPYHTQSFLEAKGFGLIENKGKDSVLKKGTKKYVLALENCEHTPDASVLSASDILYDELGIHDMYTLKKLLTGEFLDVGDYKLMGQALVSMVTYHTRHGGRKLVGEWDSYNGPNFDFKEEKEEEKISIPKKIDTAINNIIHRGK